MRISRTTAAILLVLSALPVLAQSTPAPTFRFSKPIEVTASKPDELFAFVIDDDIWDATRADLADVRIRDDKHVDVPYHIAMEMEQRTDRIRRTADATIVSAKPEGRKLEVRVKLPEGFGDAEALVVGTPLMNYERTVTVEGSPDGAAWKTLVRGAVLFDYSKFLDVSNREIALPKNADREFRLTIDDLSDERISPLKELTRTFKDGKEQGRIERTIIETLPFRIDRIIAVRTDVAEQATRPKWTRYDVVLFDAKTDAKRKVTSVTVTTRRQPLTELAIETPGRNFSRRADVQVHRETAWERVATGTLTKISFREPHRDETTLSFAERRSPTFLIEIDNEDNPPLEITGVKARGIVQRVLFLAQPGRKYQVEYGLKSAVMPKYETAALLAQSKETPVIAKLGAQVENKIASETPPATSILNNPWFLGGAIVVMVVVLGWCLLRAGKKLDGLPKN